MAIVKVKKTKYSGPSSGFSLIELSIVLVIIGLIVGGVLVGQDLIRAAEVRGQVTQIEKLNTAVNTFRNKYGYIPGDIKDPEASSFGFVARGTNPGEGDGNGLIEGNTGPFNIPQISGSSQQCEAAMFWLDLGTANLMDGAVNGASQAITGNGYGNMPFSPMDFTTYPSINMWFPTAKIGNGNFIQVYSNRGSNYFAVSAISSMFGGGGVSASPTIQVRAAAAIDSKIDDGFPQTGNVTAQYLNSDVTWVGASDTSATLGSSTTCYDNGGSSGQQKYSLSQNGGARSNCALSFRFQ